MKKLSLFVIICAYFFATALNAQVSFSDIKLIDYSNQLNITNESPCFIDIDHDGDKDLVFQEDNSIKWLEHDENHHLYIKHNDLIPNTKVLSIIPVDLDQDGLEDLLCMKIQSGVYWIWYKNLGNAQVDAGHLVVAPAAQYDPQSYVNKVFDLDHDGDLDFVFLPNYSYDNSTHIDWVENDGNENFSAPEHLLTSPYRIGGFALEDLDDDALVDLAYTEVEENPFYNPHLYIVKNNGNGLFLNKVFVKDSVDFRIKVADVDLDGALDIVTYGHRRGSNGSIDWIKNNGNGSFLQSHDLPGSWDNWRWDIADIDNDGDIDVYSKFGSQTGSSAIRIFRNNGAGLFDTPQLLPLNNPSTPFNQFFMDWDENGTPDYLYVMYSSVSLYKNEGNANFALREIISNSGTLGMAEPKVGDIDGDGRKDIVGGNGNIAVGYHQGTNEDFGFKAYLSLDTTKAHSYLADLDHDNDLDLVRYSDKSIYWLANDGAGQYGTNKITIQKNPNITALKIKDLNGDGAPDIIFQYFTGVPLSNGLVVLINNGNAIFTATLDVNAGTSQITQSDLADLDGDDDQDLFYTNKLKELVWYKNDGTGQFSDKQSITTLPFPNITVLATDMDVDGDLDIFYCNGLLPYAFYIHKNDGFGVFASASIQDLDFPIYLLTAPHAADLDKDGDNDIVFGGEKCIFRLENTGQGVLNAPEYVVQSNEIPYWNVELEDLNDDGQIDILGVASDLSKLGWFENQTVVATKTADVINNNLSLSPNPAASETQLAIISYNIQCQYLIELQDLKGKTLNTYKSNDSNFSLQRNNLPAGVYFVRVRETKSGKLLGVEKLIWN